jgi:hypothetical protein
MGITEVVDAVRAGRVRVTDHADEEAAADHLTLDDIYSSVLHGEVIENYSADKPYPSCLISRQTPSGVAVHSVWAYNRESRWTVLVTVYRPDPERWLNWRERRK